MSEQPRLLFCCFDVLPAPTGLSRRVTEYLKGLSDRFQVVVLSTKTPDHSHIERYQGARLLRVPVGSGDLQSRIQAFDRAVRRQLESEEYVLAHFFDPFGGYALADQRAQYGFRLVYDAQTFPSQELRYTHPSVEADRRFLSKVRRQELYCLMNADVVICGSEVTRDYVLSLGAPPLSLHVFPQPVDLQPYTRQAMGQPDGSPMKLLHLGSHLPYQGLQTLLRAMQLALRHADMRLLVVGPKHPDSQPALEELVAELKLLGKVEFQPPVPHDNLHKVLGTADVGVVTLDESDRNRQQGGPLAKVGEYLAAGRPVIAADLPVTRELIPENARVLFPAGDFKALAEVLVRLARDAAERVRLGEQARAGAERFDASTVRGRLLDLYDSLATRGKVSAASDQQGEVTQLRAAGSETSKIRQRAQLGLSAEKPAPRPPADTLDEEPPVVVGTGLEPEAGAPARAHQGVTEPNSGSPETPVVMGRPLREGPTPVQPPPAAQVEPTPITSARPRRTTSKHAKVVVPPGAAWPEPMGIEKTDVVPPEPKPPPKVKRTTEGKGVRSPFAPPLRGQTSESKAARSPAETPVGAPPSQGKGVRAPIPPPPASPPMESLARPLPLPPASPPMQQTLPLAPPPRPIAPSPASPPQSPQSTTDRSMPPPPASPPPTRPKADAARPPAASPPGLRPAAAPAPAASPPPPAVTAPVPTASVPMPVLPPEQKTAPLSVPPLELLAPPKVQAPPARPRRSTDGRGQRAHAPHSDEPVEISADEVESLDDVESVDDVQSVDDMQGIDSDDGGPSGPVALRVDPWLSQLLFGYCPPETLPFERPPPPTTMPGKEPAPR